MKWVTRSHVHVDRVACPWLINRFIDSNSVFIFAAKSRIDGIVKEEGAIPFDVEGVELGHKDGLCSFDAIINKYKLTDEALLLMAKIINAADTDNLQSHPVAAGLDAIAVGYSILYCNDNENIKKQFDMYDALYAWCRMQVQNRT